MFPYPIGLARQTFATFGTPTVDDAASGLGGHPLAKTVSARPLDSARLKGSFHLIFPLSSHGYINNTLMWVKYQ